MYISDTQLPDLKSAQHTLPLLVEQASSHNMDTQMRSSLAVSALLHLFQTLTKNQTNPPMSVYLSHILSSPSSLPENQVEKLNKVSY